MNFKEKLNKLFPDYQKELLSFLVELDHFKGNADTLKIIPFKVDIDNGFIWNDFETVELNELNLTPSLDLKYILIEKMDDNGTKALESWIVFK